MLKSLVQIKIVVQTLHQRVKSSSLLLSKKKLLPRFLPVSTLPETQQNQLQFLYLQTIKNNRVQQLRHLQVETNEFQKNSQKVSSSGPKPPMEEQKTIVRGIKMNLLSL